MLNRYTVIVVLESKSGHESELESSLLKLLSLSRQEQANIEYRLHRDHENPCQFILYEQWASRDEHQAQFKKSYVQEISKTLENILAKPYILYILDEI